MSYIRFIGEERAVPLWLVRNAPKTGSRFLRNRRRNFTSGVMRPLNTTLAQSLGPKLVRYDAMVHAIEEANKVDEVKEIIAESVAMAAYYKIALNRDNERKCIEIRIRAERRAG